MTTESSRLSRKTSRSHKGRIQRTDPVVPASAKQTERKIAATLRRLIAAGYSSCLDRGFVEKYARVQNLFSEYQREVLEKYSRKVSCGPDCGVCCNHWPEDTYSFEVIIIADYLKKRRPADVDRVREALRGDIACLDGIRDTLRTRLLDPRARAALGDIDPYDAALSSFYQFNRPCPLLDESGSCSIYDIRPVTCRVYVSFSHPKYCGPERILGDEALTYLLDVSKKTDELFDKLHFMYDEFEGDTSLRSMLYKCLSKHFVR
jgi:Fe-S-cluster containining protein